MPTTTYSKLYYEANKEAILAQQKVRRQTTTYKEKMRIYYANYYERNRERILALSQERRLKTRKERAKRASAPISVQRGSFIVRFD